MRTRSNVRQVHIGSVVWLIALLALGLALRIVVFPLGIFAADARTFESWAAHLVSAPLDTFYASRSVDHLPGDLWILWAIGHVYRLVSPGFGASAVAAFGRGFGRGFGPGPVPVQQSDNFFTLLKLVPTLADLGIGLMLYLIARKLRGPRAGLLAAGAYLLNPASIFLSGIWGQWDSVSAFAMVAAIWAILASPAWALPILTYACLVKPQMALLVPLALLAWWHQSGRLAVRLQRSIPPILASVAVFLAVDLPFDVGLPLMPTRWTILDRVQAAWAQYTAVSVSGFNFWKLVVGTSQGWSVSDSLPFIFGLSYQTWGTILLATAVLFALILYFRRPSQEMALWTALAIMFSVFMLSTRIHERYLLPALVLALLVGAVTPRLRWLGVSLSATYLANLYYVYAGAGRLGAGGFGQYGDLVVLVASALNVLLFVAVLGAGAWLAGQPRSQRGDEMAVATSGEAPARPSPAA